MVAKIIERLTEKSSITDVQLQTLLLQKRVRKGEMGVAEAARTRKPSGVSLGSYYRVLDQARSKFERTIFTLLLGVRLELIQVQSVTRLLSMLAEVPDDMTQESLEELMTVLSAVVKSIVTR